MREINLFILLPYQQVSRRRPVMADTVEKTKNWAEAAVSQPSRRIFSFVTTDFFGNDELELTFTFAELGND